MNKSLPFIALAALTLTACTEDPRSTPQYQQLQEDSRRTEELLAERDSTINALFGTVNRISDNLRTIRSKQGQLVAMDGMELGGNMEERIMGDIERIDALLAENKSLMEQLRRQARSSTANMSELQRTLTDLEESLTEKDGEIADLKEQLSSTNSSLATLIEMYRDKAQLADMQRGELNAAYYAVGTAKELRDNGVLSKEGGVAGIGGVNKLNMDDLPKDYFTRIDVMRTQEIPLLAKKAKLVTSHPAGSYRIDEEAQRLVITAPDRFWSVSKYLVVVVE